MSIPAVCVLRYGSLEPLPDPVSLQAGELTCQFVAGELRNIAVGGVTILSRLGARITHDEADTTGRFSLISHERREDGFDIFFRGESVNFVGTGKIQGYADGRLIINISGTATSTFPAQRTGMYLRLPLTFAGHPVTIRHADGTQAEACFPGLIEEQQPVPPFVQMERLGFTLPDGKRLDILMEGSVCALYDARSHADAAFEVTPDSQTEPVTEGTAVRQQVTVRWSPRRSSVLPIPKAKVVRMTPGESSALPAIGTGHFRPDPRRSLGQREEAHLLMLSLAHLRVDVRWEADGRKNLAYVADSARRLRVPLAVALYLPDDGAELEWGLKILARELRQSEVSVARWLIFPDKETAEGRPWPTVPRDTLKAIASDAEILIGAEGDFAAFQQLQGAMPTANGMVLPMRAPLLPADNDALMAAPSTFEAIIETARFKSSDHPVHISPLTLHRTGSLPDPRQKSLFAAAWTICCLSALVGSKVRSVTLFDAVGDTGLVEGECVFPVWTVLGWLAPYIHEPTTPLVATEPDKVAGFSAGPMTFLANLTNERVSVAVPVPYHTGHVRLLDERNAILAGEEAEGFLHRPGEYYTANDAGEILVELRPYAVACLRQP